jgi:hypothetical protein
VGRLSLWDEGQPLGAGRPLLTAKVPGHDARPMPTDAVVVSPAFIANLHRTGKAAADLARALNELPGGALPDEPGKRARS